MKITLETLTKEKVDLLLSDLKRIPALRHLIPIVKREKKVGVHIDKISGAHLIDPTPAVAPFAFNVVLFPPVSKVEIKEYEKVNGITLPIDTQSVHSVFNGFRVGGFSYLGLRTKSVGSKREAAYVPFDLARDIREQRRNHRIFANFIPIARTSISHTENGVFVINDDKTLLLFDNADKVVRQYQSHDDMLLAEIPRAIQRGLTHHSKGTAEKNAALQFER